MKRFIIIGFSLCALCFCGLPTKAEEEMEEIVVTATREEKPLKDAPGAITLIKQSEIEGKNTLDITNALAYSPGAKILRYGSLGSNATIHLRGLYSQHTLVMVDDRIINAPSSGGADLSFLSADNVERIEIMRGAASSLYGGNAVAGVINIITKNPSGQPKSYLNTLYGSYDTSITQFSDSRSFGGFGYIFNGNYKSSQGHRDNSAYYSNDSHLKMNYKWADEMKLSLDIGANEGKNDLPGTRPAKDPALRTASQKTFGDSKISTSRDSGESAKSYLNLVFNIGHFKVKQYGNYWDDINHQEWISVGAHYTRNSNYRSATYGTEIIADLDYSYINHWTAGLSAGGARYKIHDDEVNLQTVTLTESKWNARRGNYAAFAQNEIKLDNILFTIGGRWDNPTDFATQLTGKGNILWHINETTSMRVSGGSSYRAPSLNDLNWPKDAFSEGNPELQPEKGKTYEAGIKHELKPVALVTELTIFRQNLKNMIAWAPTGSMGPWGNRWHPSNLNTAWITGLELGVTYRQIKNITFNLNYTFLDAYQRNKEARQYIYDPFTWATLAVISKSETRQLAYTPVHKTDIGINFANLGGAENLFLDMDVQYIASTYQYYGNSDLGFPVETAWTETKKQGGYWLVNMKIRKNTAGNFGFFIGMENITNKEYVIQLGSSINDRGYPMPGRTVLAGAEFRF
ncbi:MAG: TonB-dependent receptor [Planctomycetes bacterium]|nr:TonB-dependent receptor [Planctomycetota bacterium]